MQLGDLKSLEMPLDRDDGHISEQMDVATFPDTVPDTALDSQLDSAPHVAPAREWRRLGAHDLEQQPTAWHDVNRN